MGQKKSKAKGIAGILLVLMIIIFSIIGRGGRGGGMDPAEAGEVLAPGGSSEA